MLKDRSFKTRSLWSTAAFSQRASLSFDTGEFVYKVDRKHTAHIIYHEERLDEKTRIIVYKDIDENNSKRKSFKQLIDEGDGSYTQEKYDAYSKWWGVYFLQTTAPDPADVIYSDYKGRWTIETYNNYLKNDAHFNDLKIQDYYIQHGFDFVMLVTGLSHAKLNSAARALNKPGISTADVLIKARHLRMVKRDDAWQLHNTRTKDIELLESLGFTPELTYPA